MFKYLNTPIFYMYTNLFPTVFRQKGYVNILNKYFTHSRYAIVMAYLKFKKKIIYIKTKANIVSLKVAP